MSLFGSLMGDFEEDPLFGHHMRSLRQMNTMMNSMFSDPFGMFNPFEAINAVPSALTGGFPNQQPQRHGLLPFGFPPMSGTNRLLGNAFHDDGMSFSSSRMVTMSQGPDGRPQVYQATSSTKSGPGGVRETQRTVQDSRTGVKKMAIGHHIGERGHVIEREQNVHTGQREERQDFINLEEDDAEDFDREFTQRSRSIGNGGGRRQTNVPAAIMPANTSSIHPHPYSSSSRRQHRHLKGRHQSTPQHHVQIEELPADYDDTNQEPNTPRVASDNAGRK